jgi:hypothetical protein
MSPLEFRAVAEKVRCDAHNLWVSLRDGRQLSVPLTYFPRLLRATPKQRKEWQLSGGGTGIHWDELDEDISVSNLLLGNLTTSNHRKNASLKDRVTIPTFGEGGLRSGVNLDSTVDLLDQMGEP